MPDISMCANAQCEAKARCHRHPASGTRPSAPWQAYSSWGEGEATSQCQGFWPKREYDQPPKETGDEA